MKTYTTIEEAMKDLKTVTGRSQVVYMVDEKEVSANEFRASDKPIDLIYCTGLKVVAEK